MWRSRPGFTLVELIVTVAVVAVMAAAAISVMGPSSRQYGRDARRQSDLQSIASALEIYRTDNGTYPGTTGWVPTMIAGGYMRSGPTDPAGGSRVYAYQSYYFGGAGLGPTPCNGMPTRCPGFSLCAGGEKGTPTPAPAGYPACGSCGTGVTCTIKVTNP